MPYNKELWEEIRVLWVTGEQKEAKHKFYKVATKDEMLSVILAAIVEYWKNSDDHIHDGSLTDLVELIVYTIRRK